MGSVGREGEGGGKYREINDKAGEERQPSVTDLPESGKGLNRTWAGTGGERVIWGVECELSVSCPNT